MRDPMHTAKCDHSTRGAQLALAQQNLPLAFAVAGHHGHLPDGGERAEKMNDRGTLMSRKVKQVPGCEEFLKVWPVTMPSLRSLGTLLSGYDRQGGLFYALAFFTRMLHSCLVDADSLDTERFMRPEQAARGQFLPPRELMGRLDAYMARFAGERVRSTRRGRTSAAPAWRVRSCRRGFSPSRCRRAGERRWRHCPLRSITRAGGGCHG